MIFGIKKIDNFNPYIVMLDISTNIPVLWLVLWSRVTYLLTRHWRRGHISTQCGDERSERRPVWSCCTAQEFRLSHTSHVPSGMWSRSFAAHSEAHPHQPEPQMQKVIRNLQQGIW